MTRPQKTAPFPRRGEGGLFGRIALADTPSYDTPKRWGHACEVWAVLGAIPTNG